MAKKKAEMQQAVSAEESQKKNKKSKDKDASVDEQAVETDVSPDSDSSSATEQDVSSGSTECVDMDAEEDNSILATMRRGRMTACEIYRVSQSFFDAKIDIAPLLLSQEKNLVLNTLEILSRNNYWQPEVLQLLDAEDAEIRESARAFAISFLGCDKTIANDIAEITVHIANSDNQDPDFSTFLNKVVTAFLVQFSHGGDSVDEWIPAFVHLLSVVDQKRIEHLLYDPSENVRVSVLRHIMSQTELQLHTLVAVLILLRDKSEKVPNVLTQLIGKFAQYPEIAIPALMDYFVQHQDKKQMILDVIRKYKDDAYQPLVSLLDAQSDEIAHAVQSVMETSPLRYLDALKTSYQLPGITPQAKKRIEMILKAFIPHVDQPTGAAIRNFFEPPKPPVALEEYPKARQVELMDPVLDYSDPFYSTLLDDKALQAYINTSDDNIMRLLNDARIEPCINALNLIRIRGKASGAIRMNLVTYVKSSNPEIGKAAALAYDKTFEGEPIELTKTFISAIGTVENRELAAHYFGIIKASQTHINNLMDMYAKDPGRYKPLVIRLLRDDPSKDTIDAVAKCFSPGVPIPCMVVTLQMLTSNSVNFDFSPFRKRLLELIRDPGCRGEYAVTLRRYSLRILNKLVKEGDHDQPTIDAIQSIYKQFYHPDLKDLATEILRKMDVDSFDDLEEKDDDFGDLDD